MLSTTDIVFIVSALITIGVSLFLTILVFSKNRKPEMSKIFIFWMGLSVYSAICLILSTFYRSEGNSLADFFWMVAGTLQSVIDPCIAIHFILIFSNKSEWFTSKRYNRIIPYVPCIIFYVAIAQPLSNYLSNPGDNVVASALGSFLQYTAIPTYFVGIVVVMIFFITLLYMTYAKANALRKHDQLRFILVGIGIIFFNNVVNAINFMLAANNIDVAAFGQIVSMIQIILIPISAILFTYVILRYKMLDVKVFVRRSMVYAALSLSMIAIFVVVNQLIQNLLQDTILGDSDVASILAAFAILPFFHPLEKTVEKLVEKVVGERKLQLSHETEMDLYNSLLNTAWADGNVSDKEEEMLFTLRETLHITDEEHKRLELNIKKRVKMA
ncbi:MAG: hypothetical protein WC974_05455 [Thermoplasmata archaeon]